MLTIAALLLTALLFGGMVLYSFGFAAFLFTHLPADDAGALLRRAFPHFYTWVIVTAALAAGVYAVGDRFGGLLLAAVAVTTLPVRQWLMPAINAATDAGDKARFNRLHGISVLIAIAQMGVVAWCLVRLL